MWIKRVAIQTDNALRVTYPTTLTTKMLAISDCALHNNNSGSTASSCANIRPDYSLTDCVLLQDTYQDVGGFVIVIGY